MPPNRNRWRRCRHCHEYFKLAPTENAAYCNLACAEKGPSYLPYQIRQFEDRIDREDEAKGSHKGRRRNPMKLDHYRR